MSALTAQCTERVRELVFELCGVYLDETKEYLIEGRLRQICEELGCDTYSKLVDFAAESITLQTRIVDALTTNETLFFRDQSPFEALRHRAIPALVDARAGTENARRLRIWSAACSSGQEAYSIAMTLADLIPDIHAWDIQIVGSDVSNTVIEQAGRGIYSALEVERGVSLEHLDKYFVAMSRGRWRVREEIRQMCRFERRNLIKPLLGVGHFDVIFCRNVAIYFTPTDRRDLFRRMVSRLADDGYLFVGSSECLSDLGEQFTPHRHCRSVYYQPNLRTPAV